MIPSERLDRIRLSVCIPCYNEAEGIESTVRTVATEAVRLVGPGGVELVLADDGSRDGTRRILERLQRDETLSQVEIVVCGFERNRGRGAALREAIGRSTGTWVVCLDADLSYDVSHIGAMLETLEGGSSPDVVVVSPYMRGGAAVGVPWSRLLVSRIANRILAGSFEAGVRTVTCVVRGYRGDFVRRLPCYEDGKGVHLELLRVASIEGGRIVEIPGRLAWSRDRRSVRRGGGRARGTRSTARQHLLYGLLVRPARILRYLAVALLLLATWQCIAIVSEIAAGWVDQGRFLDDLWHATAGAFERSPHSFLILLGSSIVGSQIGLFLILLKVLQLQQEESLRYLFGLRTELLRGAPTGGPSCAD